MENATKAFIIAAGMLFAMLIVSLLVWVYNNISATEKTKVDTETMEQIVDFNKQFEAYNKNTVRGYQMISLVNLAKDMNERYKEDDGYYRVEVILKKPDGPNEKELPNPNNKDITYRGTLQSSYSNYYDMIKYIDNVYNPDMKNNPNANDRNAFKQMYFKCTRVVYDNEKGYGGTGRVMLMVFEENPVDFTI